MKTIFSFLLIWQFSLILKAGESTEFLLASEAQKIFNYENKLKINNEIPNDLRRIKGFLWGESYVSPDKALVYVPIIYQSHSLLNSENILKLKNAEKGFHKLFLEEATSKEKEIKEIKDPVKQKELMVEYEKWREKEIKNKVIKPVNLSNGAAGFIQPFGFPPMSLMITVTDPQEKFDLALVIFNLISEVKPEKTNILPATKKYLENMDVEKMARLLEHSLNQIYPEMEEQYRKLQSTTTTNSVPERPQKP